MYQRLTLLDERSVMTTEERRRYRSSRPSEALHLLLRATAERFNLDAIVLADEDGLVIQYSGDPTASDMIAAYAPLLQDSTIRAEQVRETILGSNPEMSTCSIGHRMVGGTTSLHVCAVGVARTSLDQALVHATTSIERILTELAA